MVGPAQALAWGLYLVDTKYEEPHFTHTKRCAVQLPISHTKTEISDLPMFYT